MGDASMPFTLLEEVFDTQTIPAAQRLFSYLETRVDRLTAGMESGKGKALVLLRLCNELLRRLSKAEDTIFCGRILIFLSKSFPIHERSAVNLRGEFNTENVTIYDDVPVSLPTTPTAPTEGEPDADADQMDIDDMPDLVGMSSKSKPTSTSASESTKLPPDEAEISLNQLYRTFWSLQHDFADPTRLFVPENFARFKTGLEATMARFRIADAEHQKTAQAAKTANSAAAKRNPPAPVNPSVPPPSSSMPDKATNSEESESFNPKYLTSRELFSLQIGDLTFRRHVLVQSTILLNFLLSLTTSAKLKWTTLHNPNRSVQYTFTLPPADETWCLDTTRAIVASLTTDLSGRLFNRLIDTIITREENWVTWKLEGCASFDLPPLPASSIDQAKASLAALTAPPVPYRHVMGTPTLSRLWRETGSSISLEALKSTSRHLTPTIDELAIEIDKEIEEGKDALFPSDIEMAKEKVNTNTWKAFRVARGREGVVAFNRFEIVEDPKEEEGKNWAREWIGKQETQLVDLKKRAEDAKLARERAAAKTLETSVTSEAPAETIEGAVKQEDADDDAKMEDGEVTPVPAAADMAEDAQLVETQVPEKGSAIPTLVTDEDTAMNPAPAPPV